MKSVRCRKLDISCVHWHHEVHGAVHAASTAKPQSAKRMLHCRLKLLSSSHACLCGRLQQRELAGTPAYGHPRFDKPKQPNSTINGGVWYFCYSIRTASSIGSSVTTSGRRRRNRHIRCFSRCKRSSGSNEQFVAARKRHEVRPGCQHTLAANVVFWVHGRLAPQTPHCSLHPKAPSFQSQ